MAVASSSTRSFPQLLLMLLSISFLAPMASAQEVTRTIVIPAPTQPPSSSYTSTEEFQDTMLDVTNTYREEHHADPLTWNDTLADTALDWAERCQWEHSHGPTGENLAMGFQNATAAVSAWGDERDLYDFDEPTGFTEETGHFTQLVWRDTTSVGCARVDCGTDDDDDDDDDDEVDAQGWYVVCEYWPPGNVLGDARFNSNVLSTDASGTGRDTSAATALGRDTISARWALIGATLGFALLF